MSTALLLPTLDAHDGASAGEQLQAASVELVHLSLAEVVRAVEEQLWMVRAQLPNGGA